MRCVRRPGRQWADNAERKGGCAAWSLRLETMGFDKFDESFDELTLHGVIIVNGLIHPSDQSPSQN